MRRGMYQRLGHACKRFGPGRLPGAKNRAIGGAYAGASTALLAILIFFGLIIGICLLGDVVFQANYWGYAIPLLFFATLPAPSAVLGAFVAGGIVWGVMPEEIPFYGPVTGATTMTLAYVLSSVPFSLFFLDGEYTHLTASEAIFMASGYMSVGFSLSAWMIIPIGAIGGHLYVHAGLEETEAENV